MYMYKLHVDLVKNILINKFGQLAGPDYIQEAISFVRIKQYSPLPRVLIPLSSIPGGSLEQDLESGWVVYQQAKAFSFQISLIS